VDSFENIIALLSIIVGLGITHLFVGISRLITIPYHFPVDFGIYFFSNRRWFFAALLLNFNT
jgi:hypothetical protein